MTLTITWRYGLPPWGAAVLAGKFPSVTLICRPPTGAVTVVFGAQVVLVGSATSATSSPSGSVSANDHPCLAARSDVFVIVNTRSVV